MARAEFGHQRQTFERERQSFTEAAIRLSREVRTGPGSGSDPRPGLIIWNICRLQRRDLEQQKAQFVKQQYLSGTPGGEGRRSSALSRWSHGLKDQV